MAGKKATSTQPTGGMKKSAAPNHKARQSARSGVPRKALASGVPSAFQPS